MLLLSAQYTVHYFIALGCILLLLIVVRAWLEAESILNWYIHKYNNDLIRFARPPKRPRWHRWLLACFMMHAAKERRMRRPKHELQ